jgi:hypothetical protein
MPPDLRIEFNPNSWCPDYQKRLRRSKWVQTHEIFNFFLYGKNAITYDNTMTSTVHKKITGLRSQTRQHNTSIPSPVIKVNISWPCDAHRTVESDSCTAGKRLTMKNAWMMIKCCWCSMCSNLLNSLCRQWIDASTTDEHKKWRAWYWFYKDQPRAMRTLKNYIYIWLEALHASTWPPMCCLANWKAGKLNQSQRYTEL